jgi:hypothetical protein
MELITAELQTSPTLCAGQTVLINSGLVQGTNVFVWRENGVIMSGETGTYITVTDPGWRRRCRLPTH